MNRTAYAGVSLVAVLLLLAGCSGGDNPSTASDSQDLDRSPELISASALSNHYVEVSFSEPAGAEAEDPASYRITAPDSSELQVLDVSLSSDRRKAILSTATQKDVDYLLAPAVQTSAGLRTTSSPHAAFAGTGISFAGSLTTEPFLASAISLSNTTVLLTFSERIKSGLEQSQYYRISSPDLAISAAQAGDGDTTVLLTTEAQEHANYTVRVTNVRNVSGTIINPFLSSASFVGIAPDDSMAPQLSSADSLGNTQVLLSFNEPIDAAGADPLNFNVTPALVVTGVEFSAHRTQAVLTTLPQIAGTSYTVSVTNVEDDAGNLIDANANSASFTPNLAGSTPVAGNELPRMSGAASQGNTSVLVAFSKPMGDSAIDPKRYVIVQETVNPQAGALYITAAAFADSDRTDVILTTLSQNEVTYRVTAVGVKDLSGNALEGARAVGGRLFDPASALFPGTPASGDSLADFDGDGLTDNEEQRGWSISIAKLNGDVVVQEVTSDPYLVDSDGDGVSDFDEKNYLIDPRDRDTDDDQLTDYQELNEVYSDPFDQDTDDDALADGLEHNFFKISPILADTDGDQLPDGEEILLANRNPRIADLPRPRIQIDNVNMTLDARFEFADTAGTSTSSEATVETTLTRGEDETFSTSNETSTISTIETSTELTAKAEFPKGGGVEATVGASAGLEQGNTSTFGNESSISSEEAYHDSLTLTEERDFSQSVTRTVEGASLKVDMSIENTSDIPFTISNLELTAQAQDPRDRRRLIPIASLIPENPNLDGVNLGTLGDLDRGPFVFTAVEVFPQQIENLMKSPRGLIVKLANFDITDEAGRNFVFTSQEVLDRTAGIDIDFGNGEVESYRVATHSTFDEFGGANGITMAYALSDILGLSRTATIHDGGNGLVETSAAGDDVQVKALGAAVEPGVVIISAGPDGVLNSVPVLDDEQVDADYQTTVVNTDTDGDGVNDKLVEILTRVRDVETGFADQDPNDGLDERKLFWVVFASRTLDPGIGFNDLVLRAGEQYNLTYVQDRDEDGVWAREEFLYGSSDLDANSDDDGLSDAEEIQQGWTVQIRGEKDADPVYPNPVQQDSDRDRLLDQFERACGLDPRQRDTDLDGLTDWEELFGKRVIDDTVFDMAIFDPESGVFLSNVAQYSGAVILDGGNGIVETTAAGSDVQTASGAVTRGGVVVSGGTNLTIESTPGGDDFKAAAHLIFDRSTSQQSFDDCNTALGIGGFATDPLNPDTDGDLIADGDELTLGINPNDASDGPLFLDDDGDGVPNLIERLGFSAIVNGVQVTHFSSPNNPDSDDDGLPDLLEHFIGSNPQSVDTDADNIGDAGEYLGGGQACVTVVAGQLCTRFEDKLVDNYQNFVNACDAADVCFVDNSQFSGNPGTNLNEADSDFDGINDPTELGANSISVNGATVSLAAPYSDPLLLNSDSDGWNDGTERAQGTDPRDADTDGDGTQDDIEATRSRDPNYQDRRVLIRYDRLVVVGDCERFLFGTGPGEFRWSLNYQTASDVLNGNGPFTLSEWSQGSDYSIDGSATINLSQPASPIRFVARYGQQFRLEGFLQELDDFGADGTLDWDTTYTVNGSLVTQSPVFSTSNPAGDCDNADWDVEASIVVD